jgi:hypothetical protein
MRVAIDIVERFPRLISAIAGLEAGMSVAEEWASRWSTIIKVVVVDMLPKEHTPVNPQQAKILMNTWTAKTKNMTVDTLKASLTADACEGLEGMKKDQLIEMWVAKMGEKNAASDKEKADAWSAALDCFADKAMWALQCPRAIIAKCVDSVHIQSEAAKDLEHIPFSSENLCFASQLNLRNSGFQFLKGVPHSSSRLGNARVYAAIQPWWLPLCGLRSAVQGRCHAGAWK